jgi:hypothetical protein
MCMYDLLVHVSQSLLWARSTELHLPDDAEVVETREVEQAVALGASPP